MDLFSRRGLSIDRLRSFLAVADAGSIARAAPNDPVRQSQLSRQIGELEAFFGHALVARRGRRVVATAVGLQLAATVRETLRGLRDVAVATAPAEIVLGAGDSVLHAWLIPRMPALARTVRSSSLDAAARSLSIVLASMHGGEVVSGLREARLDLGVARRVDVGADLRHRALGALDFALFVPRALRRRLPPAQLVAAVPFAAVYGDPEIDQAVAALAPELRPALRCETFPQAQRAVLTGHYAAVLPALARRDLPAGEFDRIPLPAIPTRELVLVWHPRLERQRPQVAACVPVFVEAFALPR
jgi:DNA-binding transcriptional LysR family regulator